MRLTKPFFGKIFLLVIGLFMFSPSLVSLKGGDFMLFKKAQAQDTIELPDFSVEGEISLEKALDLRKSTRSFTDESLTLEEAAQLLWAAQGVNRPEKDYRTAPSAGATFPLEVYLAAGNVDGLEPGVYRYLPLEHKLEKVRSGDPRADLHAQALRQSPVRQAPAVIAIAGIYERTTGRYGERGKQYVHNEVGHAGQNVQLQSAALDLGSVVIGAFSESGVQQVLGLESNEVPFYLMPVGR